MLCAGLAVSLARSEDGRCAQAHWDDPKSTRELDGRRSLQRIQPVMRARANHRGNVVDGDARPGAKLDLLEAKCMTHHRERVKRSRIKDEDRSHRNADLAFGHADDRSNSRDG